MNIFEITIIHDKARTTRRVIASDSISALITGMAFFNKKETLPLSVFCKPIERIAPW